MRLFCVPLFRFRFVKVNKGRFGNKYIFIFKSDYKNLFLKERFYKSIIVFNSCVFDLKVSSLIFIQMKNYEIIYSNQFLQ